MGVINVLDKHVAELIAEDVDKENQVVVVLSAQGIFFISKGAAGIFFHSPFT